MILAVASVPPPAGNGTIALIGTVWIGSARTDRYSYGGQGATGCQSYAKWRLALLIMFDESNWRSLHGTCTAAPARYQAMRP